MVRRLLPLAFVAALAACGMDDDGRPATFEVVTLTVLAPSCGQVQCHSTITRTQGLAFDTLDVARASMREVDVRPGVGADLLDSELFAVITGEDELMPPDAPLADHDIELIRRWLVADAPGL